MAVLLVAALALTGSPAVSASAAPAGSTPTRECSAAVPSPVRPDYHIADPACDHDTGAPFTPLTNSDGSPRSDVYSGIDGGASWRIEIPRDWTGELVLFTHGNHPSDDLVYVESPAILRESFIERGFAWAASSYRANGFAIGEAVADSHAVLRLFDGVAGRRPSSVYLFGYSLGGLVTSVLLEQYPGTFVGALPACGLLAETPYVDYLLDNVVTAAALTRTPLTYPLDPPPGYPAEFAERMSAMLPALGSGFGQYTAPTLTPLGQRWSAAVQQRSGGTRPGFSDAFRYWYSIPGLEVVDPAMTKLPLMFSLYPGLDGGRMDVADGNLAANLGTVYRTQDGPITPDEIRLNADALRVARTASPWYTPHDGAMDNRGRPGVPVLTLNGIGDLLTPLGLAQQYTRRVTHSGQQRLLVNRAIRGVEHCDFSAAELNRSFDDLVRWVRTGTRPAGDDVLDQRVVASAAFGCRFTDGPHRGWTEPCPASLPRRA